MKPENKKINILFFTIFSLCFLFYAVAINATENCTPTQAEKTKPQIDWPSSPLSQKTLSETTTLSQLVQYIFEWGVGLGGLAVFIALIIAGIEYITSIANPGKLQDARERIKSSLIGLILLLSSWAIFNLINPSLNTLQDIDTSSMIVKGGVPTVDTCVNNWDCCKIPGCDQNTCAADNPDCCIDFNCAPENFACCQKNDTNCIKNRGYKTTFGATDNDQSCKKDSDCKENYCFCDRTTKPNWTQSCKPNPKVCINIIGDPKLGCDLIAFYDAPGHKMQNSSDEPFYQDIDFANSGWINPTGKPIKSFQALKYAKTMDGAKYIDDSGNATDDKSLAQKIPCGVNSCGCKVNICIDVNPAQGSCVNPDGAKLAFNTDVDGDHPVVYVIDESKGAFEEAAKFGSWLYDSTIGRFKDWLQ